MTNYQKLAEQLIEEIGVSGPCGKCALCGNRGNHASIVPVVHEINVFSHVVKLRQNLNCNSFGIYVAICKVCDCKYVGQTKNNFSTRRRAHRCTWVKFTAKKKDSAALLRHFAHNHPDIFYSKPDLSSCYSVVFVDQPNIFRLNFCEAKWLRLFKADINIQKMILPKIR